MLVNVRSFRVKEKRKSVQKQECASLFKEWCENQSFSTEICKWWLFICWKFTWSISLNKKWTYYPSCLREVLEICPPYFRFCNMKLVLRHCIHFWRLFLEFQYEYESSGNFVNKQVLTQWIIRVGPEVLCFLCDMKIASPRSTLCGASENILHFSEHNLSDHNRFFIKHTRWCHAWDKKDTIPNINNSNGTANFLYGGSQDASHPKMYSSTRTTMGTFITYNRSETTAHFLTTCFNE